MSETDPLSAIDELTRRVAEMSDEAIDEAFDGARQRIHAHRAHLARSFVGREEAIEIALLCAVAQEPLLLLGPPGTGKSALSRRLIESLSIPQSAHFEYTLTSFSEPSELLGPVDLLALREGRFRRRVEGMLPTATSAFLDELFKAGSALLNTLLTLLNERGFYQQGRLVPARLLFVFAASNELPADEGLRALADRFPLKIELQPIKEHRWDELLELGVAGEVARSRRQRPWLNGPASLEDLLVVNRALDLELQREQGDEGAALRAQRFPPALQALFKRIIFALEREGLCEVSDRALVKLYRLLRCHALIRHGGAIRVEDLDLLRHISAHESELRATRERVDALLEELR